MTRFYIFKCKFVTHLAVYYAFEQTSVFPAIPEHDAESRTIALYFDTKYQYHLIDWEHQALVKQSDQERPRGGHQVQTYGMPAIVEIFVLAYEKTGDVCQHCDARTAQLTCKHKDAWGVKALRDPIHIQHACRTQFDARHELIFLCFSVIPDRQNDHNSDQHDSFKNAAIQANQNCGNKSQVRRHDKIIPTALRRLHTHACSRAQLGHDIFSCIQLT